MFCFICGKEINEISYFCPYCGVSLDSNSGLSLETAIEKIQELSKISNKDNNIEKFHLALEMERKYPDSGKLQAIIGSIYLNAVGTERNLDKAEQYLRRAMRNGELDACFDLGLVLKEKQEKECIHWLEKAMQNEKVDAILALGQIYDYGEIVEENPNKAMSYYNYALKLGDKRALGFLGEMYYCGQLGEENREKAFSYIKESVEAFPDDSISLYNLARCYANGIGTEIDVQNAAYYFRKALSYEPDNSEYLWAFARSLEKSNSTECIHWYDKALTNNDVSSGLTLFDIYTGGKLIKKDIYVALSYLDKAILIAQKQNDEEMLSIACEKREVFFEKPDSLLKSPYLAPQLEEKYSGISKFLKTKVLPRKFFIWLEVSIRAGHEIEFSAIRKSLDDNYPYICENEIEHSFINNSNRPNPLENDIDGINTLIEQYYFSENCKHPYKYQYWIGRLERLAQEGNLEAQAIVIGNNYSYDLAVQEGRDSSDFSLYFSLKDNFKKKYETNLMELYSSGNGYAKLAIAKYMSHCIAIDRKKVLQQAAGLGLTDAWYELGKLYSMEYLSKHKFLVEGYNGSKEYTLEMSCYENGLQCNNGKKVQLCRIKLKNNGEM